MNKITLGYLLSVLSALAFASTSLFLKLGLDVGMSALGYTLLTSIFSLAILAVMLVREGPLPKLHRGEWPKLALYSVAGAGAALAFNVALETLSISLGTILLFTYPAFVVMGSWLLGQRPGRGHLVALAITLAGAAMTTNLSEAMNGSTTLTGIGLALLAAVLHGSYMVLGERLSAGISAVAATTLTRIAILVGTLVVSPSVVMELPKVTWQGWLLCLAASSVAGVVPFLFLNRGIALIGANRVAIISVAELPFAMALGLLFQGDIILLQQWLGAILITTAVLISQRGAEEGTQPGPGTGTTGSV